MAWNMLIRLGKPSARVGVAIWKVLIRPSFEYGVEVWGEDAAQSGFWE